MKRNRGWIAVLMSVMMALSGTAFVFAAEDAGLESSATDAGITTGGGIKDSETAGEAAEGVLQITEEAMQTTGGALQTTEGALTATEEEIEENSEATGDMEEEKLDIQWLDVGGTNLELNHYWREESDYITVSVGKFYDTGKSGYVIVNLKEKTVSKPLYYDYVGRVSEGLVSVENYKTKEFEDGSYLVEENDCGYITASGDEVIGLQYDAANPFHGGYAVVAKVQAAEPGDPYADEDGTITRYGLIDRQNNVAVDFYYDGINYLKDGYYQAFRRNFEKQTGESTFTCGVLKPDGSFQEIPGRYLLQNDPYLIAFPEDNTTIAYYDYEGKKLTPDFKNAGAYVTMEDPSLIPVVNDEWKWGFYDVKKQEMAIDYEYDYVLPNGFVEGLAGVGYESDEYGDGGSLWWRKMGFINAAGKIVIPLQYMNVQPFSEGIAVVETGERQSGVYAGYGAIDKEGNEILPTEYSHVGTCQDGTIPVSWQASLYGFYNQKGEKLTPYQYLSYGDSIEGLRVVTMDGDEGKVLYGAVNRYGNEVIPLEYSGITSFYNGRALIGRGFASNGNYQISEEIGIIERPETADYDTGENTFISVFLDGKRIEFDQDPMIVNNRTLVPMRLIFEAMGAEVEWDEQFNRVTGTKGGKTVTLDIGADYAYVNGERVDLDAAAQVYGSRTLVPARFIAESLDADVDWDQESMSVFIKTK